MGLRGYSGAGLSGCGQVCSTTRVGISKRSAMRAPGGDASATKCNVPSAAAFSRENQLTLAAMSRRPRPYLPSSIRKLSRAVAVVVVAHLLVGALPPLAPHQTGVAGAAGGVVPAHVVVDDGAEDAPHVRVQAVAAGEPECVLALQGVRQIQALQRVCGVVGQHGGIAASFHIDQSQLDAAVDDEGPVAASGQHVFMKYVGHGDLRWLRQPSGTRPAPCRGSGKEAGRR